jgi:hypothetical protein
LADIEKFDGSKACLAYSPRNECASLKMAVTNQHLPFRGENFSPPEGISIRIWRVVLHVADRSSPSAALKQCGWLYNACERLFATPIILEQFS